MYANFNYQGTVLATPQDLTGMDYLHVDMWTADATVVQVTPINNSGSPAEHLVSLTPVTAGQWKSYDIPLTSFTSSGMALDGVFQMKFDGQAGNTPSPFTWIIFTSTKATVAVAVEAIQDRLQLPQLRRQEIRKMLFRYLAMHIRTSAPIILMPAGAEVLPLHRFQ
jgi:hypothetical protein